MENKKKIYMDQKGYDEYLKEIQDLEGKIKENNKEMTDAFTNAPGDGGHDNGAFEDALRIGRMLSNEFKAKNECLKNIVIVEKGNEDDLVEIGDKIRLDMIFSEDDNEETVVILTGGMGKINADGVQEVSLNSPLGEAIYQKKIGNEVSYSVNKNIINVKILEKVIELDLEEGVDLDPQ